MRRIVYTITSLCLALVLTVVTTTTFAQNITNLPDSDIKTNVSAIDSPLKSILALEPRKFEYRTTQYNYLKLPVGTQYGFVAEEFGQVFPSLVYRKAYSYMSGKNRYLTANVNTINTEALIPVLVGALKQQQQQIDQLRAELDVLKKR